MIVRRSVRSTRVSATFWPLCRLGVIVGFVTLSGCSASRADLEPYQFSLSPTSRFYSYLVINGIAQGALLTGEKRRSSLPELERADKEARIAVLAYLQHSKGQNDFQTDMVLTRYLSEIRE